MRDGKRLMRNEGLKPGAHQSGRAVPPKRRKNGTSLFHLTRLALLFVVVPSIRASDGLDFPLKQRRTAVLATVRVRALPRLAEGSGVLIAKSGPFVYILTAQHVVKDAERLEITIFSKSSKPIGTYRSARMVAEEAGGADLALLRVATTDDMPGFLRVCPEEQTHKLSGKMLAVGCDPGEGPSSVLERVVRKKLVRGQNDDPPVAFWEVDHKHARGRSGGPLLDEHGYVAGVCSGTNREKSYFTHISEIHRFLKRHGFRWVFAEPPQKK